MAQAYLALSMKLHPDRNPEAGAATHFQAAKEVGCSTPEQGTTLYPPVRRVPCTRIDTYPFVGRPTHLPGKSERGGETRANG